jgi:hypothetical protein
MPCIVVDCLKQCDAMYCGRRALLLVRNLLPPSPVRMRESEQVPLNHWYTPKLWILILCPCLVCCVSALFITTTVITIAFTTALLR